MYYGDENGIYSIYRPPEYIKILQKFHRNSNTHHIRSYSIFERVLNSTFEKIDNLFLNMNTLIERVSVLNSSSVTNYEHEQIDNLIDNKNLFGKTEMESYNNEDSHINKFNYLHNNDVTIYFLKNIKYSLYSNIKEINKYGLTNDETIKFKKSIVSLLSNI